MASGDWRKEILIGIKVNDKSAGGFAKVAKSIANLSQPLTDTAKTSQKLIDGKKILREGFFSQGAFNMVASTGTSLSKLGDTITKLQDQWAGSREMTDEAKSLLKVMGLTDVQVERLEDTAESVGNRFGILKGEFLDAAYGLASGVSPLLSMEGGEKALGDIAAGNVGLAKATKSTVEEMNKFKATMYNIYATDIKDAGGVTQWSNSVDQALFQATQVTSAAGPDLIAGFKNIGVSAKLLGNALPMDKAIMFTGIMTDYLGGAEAGTAIKNLATDWTKLGAKFEKQGIQIKDNKGRYLDLMGVMAQLRDKSKNMSEVERNQWLASFQMSQRTQKAFNTVLLNYDAFDTKMKDSAGTPEELQKGIELAVSSTTSLKEKAEASKQAMMEAFGGAAEGFTRSKYQLSAFGNQIVTAIAKTPVLGTAIGTIVPIVGEVTKGFGGFITTMGGVGKGIESMKTLSLALTQSNIPLMKSIGLWMTNLAMKLGLIPAETAVAAGATASGTALVGAGTAASIAWGPFIIIILAIIAVIAAVILIVKNWTKIVDVLKNAWKSVLDFFTRLFNWFWNTFGGLVKFLLWVFAWPVMLIITYWRQIVDFFVAVGKWIGGALLKLFDILTWVFFWPYRLIIMYWRQILDFFIMIGKWIANAFMKLLDVILWVFFWPVRLIMKFWQPINQFFGKLADGIKNVFKSAFDWITKALKQIFYNIPDFLLPVDAEINKYKMMADDTSLDAETRAVAAQKVVDRAQTAVDNSEGAEKEKYQKILDEAKKKQQELPPPPGGTIPGGIGATPTPAEGADLRMGDASQRVGAIMRNPVNQEVDKSINITVEGNADKETIKDATDKAKGLLDEQGRDMEDQLGKRLETQKNR